MKFRKRFTNQMAHQHGFSLVELMISIAIVGIIVVTLAIVFERSGRLYTTQNVSAALQEEVRAAVEIMARDMRMAAYDPINSGDFEIKTASATHLQFTLDRNDNGNLDNTGFPNCERISFRFSAAQQALQIICGESTGSQDIQQLVGGVNTDTIVTALGFDYRDSQNNSTSFIQDMRGAVVTLTAQSPAGRAGMIERSYTTWVDFRNAGPNALNN